MGTRELGKIRTWAAVVRGRSTQDLDPWRELVDKFREYFWPSLKTQGKLSSFFASKLVPHCLNSRLNINLHNNFIIQYKLYYFPKDLSKRRENLLLFETKITEIKRTIYGIRSNRINRINRLHTNRKRNTIGKHCANEEANTHTHTHTEHTVIPTYSQIDSTLLNQVTINTRKPVWFSKIPAGVERLTTDKIHRQSTNNIYNGSGLTDFPLTTIVPTTNGFKVWPEAFKASRWWNRTKKLPLIFSYRTVSPRLPCRRISLSLSLSLSFSLSRILIILFWQAARLKASWPIVQARTKALYRCLLAQPGEREPLFVQEFF